MSDSEHGVKGRNDGALSSGFASKLLRLTAVHAVINQTCGQVGMIFPTVNVRANAVVVDVGIAILRHAKKGRVHVAHGRFHLLEKILQALCVAALSGVDARVKRGQSGRGLFFDIDMNENEPLLIDTAEKILDERDVTAFDLALGIQAVEIM